MNPINYLRSQLKYVWGGLFFLTMASPSLWFMFGAESMAQGLTIVVLFYFIASLYMYSFRTITENFQTIFKILAILSIFVLIHGLTNYYWHIEQFNLTRFLLSFLYLLFFMLGAFSFVMVVTKISIETCTFALYFIFITFVLIALLSITGFSPFQVGGKPVVVYSEPSHYALAFLPFLLFIVIQASPKNKVLYLLIAFEIALILQSLTLMVGVILISLIALRVWVALIIMAMYLALYYIDPVIHSLLSFIFPSSAQTLHHIESSSYIGGRLLSPTISAALESSNGSFLVYFSGWERTYLNFLEYFGFGAGFQQLGFVESNGIAMERIINLYGRPMGLFDGGTVAAKFLSEFGLFGLILLGIYMRTFLIKIIKLKYISTTNIKDIDIKNTFFMCCFIIYSVNLFIRGLGYFTPSSFLFLSSIFWILLNKNRVQSTPKPSL